MLFPTLALTASLAALFSGVQAQNSTSNLTIYTPGGPDLWWVASSINVMSWTCHTSPFSEFTVILANQDPTKWPNLAFISIENNYDCSKEVTNDQVNAPAGTGYILQFTNILNQTDIYAQSQPFEIKAVGSAYPPASATPTIDSPSASATGSNTTAPDTGSGAQSTPSGKPSGASKSSVAGILAGAAAVLGLFLA